MARRVRGSVANDQSSSCRLLVIIALITRGRGGLDPLLHSASIICFVCPPTPGRAASAYNSSSYDAVRSCRQLCNVHQRSGDFSDFIGQSLYFLWGFQAPDDFAGLNLIISTNMTYLHLASLTKGGIRGEEGRQDLLSSSSRPNWTRRTHPGSRLAPGLDGNIIWDLE